MKARAGSAAAQLLARLPSRPILSSEDAFGVLDAPRSSVFAAINRLQEVGVLRPLTDRKRDQVWGASLIMDELEDLSIRIARAASGSTLDDRLLDGSRDSRVGKRDGTWSRGCRHRTPSAGLAHQISGRAT